MKCSLSRVGGHVTLDIDDYVNFDVNFDVNFQVLLKN